MTPTAGQGSFGYDIGRPTGACAATAAPLHPGDAVVVALVETPEAEGFARLDFAADAWTDGARPIPPARLFGYWRSVVPEPNAPTGPVIDAEGLVGMFEQLAEADPEDPADADRIALRYLITLVLVRKRELVLDRVDRSATPAVLLVRPRGVAHREDEPTRVYEPAPDADLSGILDQLGDALQLDAAEL